MIYGPGQFHTQYTDDSHNASYMTVLFDMRNLTPVEQEVWYDALINRVFHYDQKINSLIKAFVRESTTGIPYMNSLMLCLLATGDHHPTSARNLCFSHEPAQQFRAQECNG